jgi:hexosaminidase
MQTPLLLPAPRNLTVDAGTYTLASSRLIVALPALLFEAKLIQKALNAAGAAWEIVAHSGGVPAGLTLFVDSTLGKPEGYRLKITPEAITIRGADAAGVYYGCCTLRQLLEQYGRELPCLTIDDSPDFPARGVMLDISRDKVPTIDTLNMLIEKFASWKLNQLQLYTEHTFAYRAHQEVWAEASPLTGQQIMELDVLCRQHHIELVPNQNSLGHMERWLKFDRYREIAEAPDGFMSRWGEWSDPTTIDPSDPRSLELISGLYDELLPHFSSGMFNVGGDEPWELGQGKNKAAVEEKGHRVYLEWILKLHELVKARGKRMQFWGDIIMEEPGLVPELPKDLIAMEWGYEGTHDFAGHCKLFAQSGIPFYVCPGTSSWNSLVGRTENMIENLSVAATCGLANGAIGYLITDWGDRGHWQPLSVSYAGFAVGAAFSWCYETNKDADFPTLFDLHVFHDRARVMGRLVYDLGNVYKRIGLTHVNGQLMATALMRTQEAIDPYIIGLVAWQGDNSEPDIDPQNLRKVIAEIETLTAPLEQAQMQLGDAQIIKDEYQHASAMLRHGAYWLMLKEGAEDRPIAELQAEWDALRQRQREVWLMRNQPGGLEDSLKRFDTLKQEYERLSSVTV